MLTYIMPNETARALSSFEKSFENAWKLQRNLFEYVLLKCNSVNKDTMCQITPKKKWYI